MTPVAESATCDHGHPWDARWKELRVGVGCWSCLALALDTHLHLEQIHKERRAYERSKSGSPRCGVLRVDSADPVSVLPEELPADLRGDVQRVRCECDPESYCPTHKYRWEYEQDERAAHEALDALGAPVADSPPDDVILSVAGRISRGAEPFFAVYYAAKNLLAADPPRRGDGRMLLHHLELRVNQASPR